MKIAILFSSLLFMLSLQAMASGTYLPPPQIPPEGVECEEGDKDCEERVMFKLKKEVRS